MRETQKKELFLCRLAARRFAAPLPGDTAGCRERAGAHALHGRGESALHARRREDFYRRVSCWWWWWW